MTPHAPKAAYELLSRALAHDEAGSSVLGDLQEDFVRMVERRGLRRARLWYWREAVLLSVSATWSRAIRALHRGPGRDDLGAVRGGGPARGLVEDTRYAWCFVRRDKGFALLVALIIGLGVGATTAVYSVVSPLMLAPLPFQDPAELVWIANDGGERASLSAVTSRSSNLIDFRELSRSFDGLTGFSPFSLFDSWTLGDDPEPMRVAGVGVAHDFLDVLRVRPLHGRAFTLEENDEGGPGSVILSHGFWERRFAGDPGVVGSTVTLNGRGREVVGVLPSTFDFSSVFSPTVGVDFLYPFPVSDATDRQGNTWSFVGRLAPGVTSAAAQADLDAVIVGLEAADPERWGLGAVVTPLQEYIAAPYRPGLSLLVGAAAAVLLIVSVNVSNLLLARAPERLHTVAMQRAMGATRFRLARQYVIEVSFFAVAGGVVGTGIAFGATAWVSKWASLGIPMLSDVSVDSGALALAVLVSLLVGLGVAALPAFQVTEGGEAQALRLGGLRTSARRGATRLREILVAAQVALACVLLIVGGLFLRSFQQVLDVELGYAPEQAVAWQLRRSQPSATPTDDARFFDHLVDRVTAVPGVTAAGLVDALPLGRNRTWGIQPPTPDDTTGYSIHPHVVDARYTEAMRIPLLEGRGLSRDDIQSSEQVVLINESGARRLFRGDDAVGQLIRTNFTAPWRIVGVVGDVRHVGLEDEPGIEVYFPYGQLWQRSGLDLVVRSALPPEVLAASVSDVVRELDPGMATRDLYALSERVAEASAPRRFVLLILGAFAGVALLLASLGIYGVLSRSVAERAPEIGIRLALGETASGVRRSLVAKTMTFAVTGIAVGVPLALLVSRGLASMLFGVEPADPATFTSMVVLLLVVAWFAGFVPAVRAARADSVALLRR